MKRSVDDLGPDEAEGRRALTRVDYNVPLEDGEVADSRRLRASYATLEVLLEHGARPVLLSHLGRPDGREVPELSLAPVAGFLERDFGHPVRFAGPADSDEARRASEELSGGEILLLENTRFLPGETSNDAGLCRRFARLGDFFVNDAFAASHRAHASVVGVAHHLRPAVAGRLLRRETEMLEAVRRSPDTPFVLAIGGAKIGDKLRVLETFLDRADAIVVGGAMANTFLAASGEDLGASLVDEDEFGTARELVRRAGDRLRLPEDLVVAAGPDAGEGRAVDVGDVPADAMALDVGPRTRDSFGRIVRECRTLFWNGPMGLFERPPFHEGTMSLARAAAEATERGALTVVGGGDSARALTELELEDAVSHVSTGGGAALEYLAEGSLPGIDVLDDVPREQAAAGPSATS